MATHDGEQARATREEHNATECRIFTLPTELRLNIFEFVISDLIHDPHEPLRPHYPRDLATKTNELGCLRVCRAMREETQSILMNWPKLWINFTTSSSIHLETIERWLDSLLSRRKVSNDKLLLWLDFGGFEYEDEMYVSSADVIFRPATQYSQHEIVLGNLRHSPLELDELHLIQDFVDNLNERDEDGEPGLANEDVRMLFKILARTE
ncbi:hypothetical protein LTR09_003044 [Extremus antarcticus]|uniref:F-box domain-containing protein n=1 Tax=Extremus antarcticus TaxID=702011 RepID=A0AAJ0GE72_9PEZI|nr:hypothetical protein LTR09_003044 [Extremus antarcticus]